MPELAENFQSLNFPVQFYTRQYYQRNGAIQKQHAQEDYWETDKYPNATFKGAIINDVDFNKNGKYDVTAIGIFSIHGVDKQIKIPVIVIVQTNQINISASFKIYLSDHNITIPKLLAQKVSEEFSVDISISIKPKV